MGDLNSRLSGLSEVGYNLKFLIPTFGLVVVLIVFFIIVAIIRKSRKGKTDIMAGITYLDVTGMKKQGLLTEEEMTKIRAAMSRQVDRQRSGPAIKAPSSLSGELALMADPEVQNLEAIAEQKAKSRGAAPMPPPQSAPAQASMQAAPGPPILPAAPALQQEPNYGDPIPPSYGQPMSSPPAVQPSAELDASAWTRGTPAPAEEIQLPADILKMADLGLITEEELERIKQRIRDKKRDLS